MDQINNISANTITMGADEYLKLIQERDTYRSLFGLYTYSSSWGLRVVANNTRQRQLLESILSDELHGRGLDYHQLTEKGTSTDEDYSATLYMLRAADNN